jgi:hypothetical protein
MLIRFTDPSPPFPQHPQPQQPGHVQPPMIYVYEKQEWEYKVVVKDAAEKELLGEQELNVLGKTGWELTGVIPVAKKVQFYFKRPRR